MSFSKFRYFPVLLGFIMALSACSASQEEKEEDTLVSVKELETSQVDVASQDNTLPQAAFVNAPSGLRLRESPNTSAKTLASLSPNTEVAIIERTNESLQIQDQGKTLAGHWVKVKVGRQEGYVFDGFLSETKFLPLSRFELCYANRYYNPLKGKSSDSICVSDVMDFKMITKREFEKLKSKSKSFISKEGVTHEKTNDTLFILGDNGTISIPDIPFTQSEEFMNVNSFSGKIDFMNAFLVSRSFYEGNDCVLIDAGTGDKIGNDDTGGMAYPAISTDRHFLLSLEANPYETCADMQLLAWENNKLSLVFNASFPHWLPAGETKQIFWVSEKSFVAHIIDSVNYWSDAGFESEDGGYLKVTLL